jgi:hypothetical protein
MIVLPAAFAIAAPRQEKIIADGAGQIFARIGREFKDTFFHWKALPYMACMVFPMGSGAAIGLLPGLAADYGVSAIHVAWLNGLGGAALTAAGAFAAGLLPATKRASITYLSVCLVNQSTLIILWLAPLHPATYYLGTTLFLFTAGSSYALFTAVILEFLGNSGKSGSSRYSIINAGAVGAAVRKHVVKRIQPFPRFQDFNSVGRLRQHLSHSITTPQKDCDSSS